MLGSYMQPLSRVVLGKQILRNIPPLMLRNINRWMCITSQHPGMHMHVFTCMETIEIEIFLGNLFQFFLDPEPDQKLIILILCQKALSIIHFTKWLPRISIPIDKFLLPIYLRSPGQLGLFSEWQQPQLGLDGLVAKSHTKIKVFWFAGFTARCVVEQVDTSTFVQLI